MPNRQRKQPKKTASRPAKKSIMAGYNPEQAPYQAFTFASNEIPNEVTIDILENKYGPSVFPHRQIIEALRKGINGSRMAKFFHGGEDTLCAGCHHHSPVGQKPPMCVNCHDKDGRSEENLFGPGTERRLSSAMYRLSRKDGHRSTDELRAVP